MEPNKGKQKVEDAGEVDTGILDDIPSPITTFDMRKPKEFAERCKKCVEEIRATMDKDTTVKFTFVMAGEEVVVPVTPPDDKTRQGTYVIRLTDGTKNLDLVADKYQSWFRGIVTSGGQRYEVDEKLPKIMKRSMSLHTSGIYPKLIDGDLPDLEVGYQQFLNAFHTLAGYRGDAKDLKKVKEAIAILLIMFFEGPRLLPVEEWIEDLLLQCSSKEIGKKFERLISDWCDDSMKFYKGVAGARKVVISDDASDVVRNHGRTQYMDMGVFRIMCRSQWEKWVEDHQIKEQEGKGQAGSKEKSKKTRGGSSSKK